MKLTVLLMVLIALAQGASVEVDERNLSKIIDGTKELLHKVYDDVTTTDWKDNVKLMYHKSKMMVEAAAVWVKATAKGAKDVVVNLYHNIDDCRHPKGYFQGEIVCIESALRQAKNKLKSIASNKETAVSKRDLNEWIEKLDAFLADAIDQAKKAATSLKDRANVLYLEAKRKATIAAFIAMAYVGKVVMVKDAAKRMLLRIKDCPNPVNEFDPFMVCIKEAYEIAVKESYWGPINETNSDIFSKRHNDISKRDVNDVIEKIKVFLNGTLVKAKGKATDLQAKVKLFWFEAKIGAELLALMALRKVISVKDVIALLFEKLKACPRPTDDLDLTLDCIKEAFAQIKESGRRSLGDEAALRRVKDPVA